MTSKRLPSAMDAIQFNALLMVQDIDKFLLEHNIRKIAFFELNGINSSVYNHLKSEQRVLSCLLFMKLCMALGTDPMRYFELPADSTEAANVRRWLRFLHKSKPKERA